jgi:MFS family permease
MAETSISRRMVEAVFRREMWPWALLGVASGLVEGSTVAILVKRSYQDVVDPTWVNLAVALLSGAPALANISSFAWSNFVHGRQRVRLLSAMQLVFAVIVGLIALVPFGPTGLVITIIAVVAARVVWTGVLTARAAVWSANYPRSVMARMTGRILVYGLPGFAVASIGAGWVLDQGAEYARWLYALAALCGVWAAWAYRRVRVRREYQMLAAEADSSAGKGAFSFGNMREILRRDHTYRAFMFWTSLYGAGNLMMNAQLVVCYAEQLQLSSMMQILLLSVVPYVLMPLFIPWWARQFDQGHVVDYRSRQCWVLVAGIAVNAVGVWTEQVWTLWLGAFLTSVAYAGAGLGWNLGHNDFAPSGLAQHYMGVHVTLTGVRGLIAPPLGILLYEVLERWLGSGFGVWALCMPLILITAGGIGFVRMKEERAT